MDIIVCGQSLWPPVICKLCLYLSLHLNICIFGLTSHLSACTVQSYCNMGCISCCYFPVSSPKPSCLISYILDFSVKFFGFLCKFFGFLSQIFVDFFGSSKTINMILIIKIFCKLDQSNLI